MTVSAPSNIAVSPADYAEKLERFAAEKSARHGIEIKAKAVTSFDPVLDLDQTLSKTIEELGADLVVMATHVPGFREHILASNAGYSASHSSISVFVVR